jgi:hypothetical protein
MGCALKLKFVLHCYIVELQRLAVLHSLLHAVTFYKLLITSGLLCYINDNGRSGSQVFAALPALWRGELIYFPNLLPVNPAFTPYRTTLPGKSVSMLPVTMSLSY